MSRPFHSRITRQNQSKNERATPKDPKIPFLGLDAKGNKNRKIRNAHPTSFCQIFQGKKYLFKSDHQKYAFGGGSSRVDTLLCPYLHINIKNKS